MDDDGIATLTLQGAKSPNIIGSPSILAGTEALMRLSEMPGLRVQVLRGPGEHNFVGGADIHEAGQS